MRACDTAAVVPSLLVAVTDAPYKRHLSTQSRQPELLSPTPEGAAPQLLYVLVIYLHLASSYTALMRKSGVIQHLQEHIRWSPLRQHMQQRHTILYGASCLYGMLLTALEQLQFPGDAAGFTGLNQMLHHIACIQVYTACSTAQSTCTSCGAASLLQVI
jgi:hypothetical protein